MPGTYHIMFVAFCLECIMHMFNIQIQTFIIILCSIITLFYIYSIKYFRVYLAFIYKYIQGIQIKKPKNKSLEVNVITMKCGRFNIICTIKQKIYKFLVGSFWINKKKMATLIYRKIHTVQYQIYIGIYKYMMSNGRWDFCV